MTSTAPLPEVILEPIVRLALLEDLSPAGDVTSDTAIAPEAVWRAEIRSREVGVIAGVDAALLALRLLDRGIDTRVIRGDGAAVSAGDTVMELSGSARSILMAERTMLNFLGHLSGIATLTREYVRAVSGTRARVTCTRKTTPGLRVLEKRAVHLGGGINHRFSLGDAVLIKDNHIAAAGGERAHCILLDNMSLETLREAVKITAGRAVLEASGNVKLATIGEISATGVDYISVGALTHSSRRLDLGLDAS
jgi:nicotinate-nucleotide pyrophosphorylase (carboxylating)